MTHTLGKRPHTFTTVLETPDRSLRSAKTGVSGVVRSFRCWLRWCLTGLGWVIQMACPETGPEIGRSLRTWVRPESPVLLVKKCAGSVRWSVRRLVRRLSGDFGRTGVSSVGSPESPVLLVKKWAGSVRWPVRRLVRRLAGVSGPVYRPDSPV